MCAICTCRHNTEASCFDFEIKIMSEAGANADDEQEDDTLKDQPHAAEPVAAVDSTNEIEKNVVPEVEKRDEAPHQQAENGAYTSRAPFDNIMKALEGQKVLVQPRVSRETIIDVLREHTDMIHHLRAEFNLTRSSVYHLLRLTESQGNDIQLLQTDMTKAQGDIVVLETSSAEFRSELDRIKETLGEISNIKKEMQMQKQSIQDINDNVAAYKVEVKDNFEAVDRSCSTNTCVLQHVTSLPTNK